MRFGGKWKLGNGSAIDPMKYENATNTRENDFGGVIDERSEKLRAKLVVCCAQGTQKILSQN